MPKPMYFYPFTDKTIDSGFVGHVSAKSALHCVAPTFGRKSFAYLWKMGTSSSTFANYMSRFDRIYVLGHCDPGDDELSTGIVGPGTHAPPRNWPTTSTITGCLRDRTRIFGFTPVTAAVIWETNPVSSKNSRTQW